MRTALALAVLLAVSGCAMTPDQITEKGVRYTHTSQQSAQRAAECSARNAEALHPSFAGTTRPSASPDEWETIIRSAGIAEVVLRATPVTGGSTVTFWIPAGNMSDSYKLPTALVQGC